jgi:phosphoribosylformimino-5-aminoimidazole carboxamide ribotide isomerase
MLVIPAIDLIDGKVVRLFKGDYGSRTTYSAEPIDQARLFESAGFTRLHIVDLEGAKAGRGRNRETIRSLIENCEIPVQIGGGIRTREDVGELIGFGARYLILGTIVLKDPAEAEKWIRDFGPEYFVISLDLRQGKLQTDGWLEESQCDLKKVIGNLVNWGITQVISTDVERDGTLEQPNYQTYSSLLEFLPDEMKLIAAGGISAPSHISELKKIGLSGAIIGRALYEGRFSWKEMLGAG